jgi:hypothetical protein
MTPEIFMNISSVVIALAALIFSIVSFNRQQARAEHHASASVKPLLSIKSQNYVNLKSIRIINYGVGTAIIRKAEFRRSSEGIPTNKIVDLFTLDILWESFVNIPPNRAIPSQGEILLVKESLLHLREQGYDESQALSILEQWQQQKTGIQVHIEYEDIYGTPMPILEQSLK